MLGAILILVAMALVFPPLVFGGGLVLSALLGFFLDRDQASVEDTVEDPVEATAEEPAGSRNAG